MSKAQQKARTLSRRVLVTLNRDVMTKSPLIVWEHEIPILEAVHGEGSVARVDPEATELDKDFRRKRNDTEKRKPSVALGLDDVFDGDPRAEYDRLAACYGMHAEVKMPCVQFVYGRFDEGRFSEMVQPAGLDELSERQLKHKLEALRVEIPKGASIADLRKQVADELAYEATEAKE